jgi:hypothetical protein
MVWPKSAKDAQSLVPVDRLWWRLKSTVECKTHNFAERYMMCKYKEIEMKRNSLFFLGLITGIVIILTFIWIGPIQSSLAKSSDKSVITQTPSFGIGGDELLPANIILEDQSASALPTPIPGETLVYFVPSDNDATATVLFLYNTDSIAHTVALRGFSYNGTLVYSININIAASSFVRLSSDSIAASPPPSWATPAPIITNFTDFTYLCSLSLPKGVKVEGYVLYNPGTGTVDPRLNQGAIPLRFSTDPATLFLPLTQKNP